MDKRKHIGIRDLKNRTSRVVDEVREKESTYVITKHGKPVAVMRPWNNDDTRLEKAEQDRLALAQLSDLADLVARAAGESSAAKAVSAQRR